MGLKFIQIQSLLIKKNKESFLFQLILDYSVLKQKLENIESQSWYFKKALDSNNSKLLLMLREYENTQLFFNESSIDSLIEKLNKYTEKMAYLKKNGMNLIQMLQYADLQRESFFLNELIALKSKIECLMSIEYYLDNPEELLKLID